MSGDYSFTAKIVSPAKCNEKPWDLWVTEIGHLSPRRDEDAAAAESKSGVSARRAHDQVPYKTSRAARYRRAGLHRLKRESMSLHGLFPQMDDLNAAVCHMCGVIVKCSAAYRHLLESHTGTEPLFPPPPPVTTLKSRSRHKKEVPPPTSVDILPVKMETSPVHTITPPLSRIMLPQQELQYLDETNSSAAPVTAEVKVCMESGELPVVSIQDTEDLPLGENITDDIFAIMNSEGITQSADDITNAADWKNIIRDIGNMQDINFPQTDVPTQDLYATLHPATLSAYTISDSDLSSIQFAPTATPMLPTVIDTPVPTAPIVKPAVTPGTPSTKSRSKTSKTKNNIREYDPNKHCGVVTADNPKPCTRSLTCKAHALSLRRMVEGRIKPFDTLLAEHRAARDAPAAPPAAPPPPPQHVAPAPLPPLLVNSSVDLGALGLARDVALTAEQQVNDIYASLLSVEDPNAVLPDTSSITSLLSQPLPPDAFLLPDEAEAPPKVSPVVVRPDEAPPEICWYATSPRPLAVCTFNASHAGGAITLGKKFATVRSNLKSSLSRSQCKLSGSSNNYYYNQSVSLSKTVHMNAGKANKPEVRKLIVTCGTGAGTGGEVAASLSELFGGEARTLNGHVTGRRTLKLPPGKRAPVLDLGFSLDPLLADEKC